MGHGHSHADRSNTNARRLVVVLLLTATYLVAEVVGGILTKSLALLADAGHMLTDVGGIALALVAMKLADRKANSQKSYGYYRVEILAAVVNAVFLLGVSLYVLYEAYERFRRPPAVHSGPMLVVAGIGLVVNIASAYILKSASKDSLNMRGAYFEVMSDLLTSVAVIVAGVVMLVTGWYYADPILSAGIGLFIFPRTWRLLREAVDVLLEATPADVDVAALRDGLSEVAGVAGVHDLHVWALTSGFNALSAHVVLAADATHDEVLASARSYLTTTFKIAHVTIQVEREGCAPHETHL